MLSANDLKNGTIFLYRGEPHKVLKYQHTALGRKGANIRVKIKNLVKGGVLNLNFTSKDRFDEVWLEKKELVFKKDIGRELLFFAPEEGENTRIDKDLVGDDRYFLTPEETYHFLIWEEEPLSLELPPSITLEIAEADPGVKGNSASNFLKSAKTVSGLEIKVPLFVGPGEKIRVDTRTGEYLERA
jgi:elongation factor P